MTTSSIRKHPVPFGKYLLLDRINIGGMAEVWRGKTFGAGGFERLVAIKRILPNIAEDEEFISMFIDEAKITVQLAHANIAQIYELDHISTNYFIAMEYIAGKDLRAIFDRCRKKGEPAPIPMTCYVIAKVCEGLDYAHKKKDTTGRDMNIVHRDVSPQNILLSYDGEVKLIDFGIAKAAGKATRTQAGILKGKFGYMSPEQIRGLPLDRRSDIFAVGVCLYELLTGERLFIGESDFSVLEKVRRADVLPPSTYNRRVPEALEKIVMKSLAREVDTRYQYASELAEDLERFLLSSDLVFTRKDLAQYMRSTFAEEVEREKQRLQEYSDMRPPESSASQSSYSSSGSLSSSIPPGEGGSRVLAPPSSRPPSGGAAPSRVGPPPSAEPTPDPRSKVGASKTPVGAKAPPVPIDAEPEHQEEQLRTVLVDSQRLFADEKAALAALAERVRKSEEEKPSEARSGASGGREEGSAPVPSETLASDTIDASGPREALEPRPTPPGITPASVERSRSQLPGMTWTVQVSLGLLLSVMSFGAGYLTRGPSKELLTLRVPAEVQKTARVRINGVEHLEGGLASPLLWPVVVHVPAGPVVVQLTADGYEPLTDEFDVLPGANKVDRTFAPRRRQASVPLRMSVSPEGAEIRLDGVPVRSVGPAGTYEGTLSFGVAHEVEVTAPGFKPYRRVFSEQDARESQTLTVRLEAIEQVFNVDSDPRGAAVMVQGREKGQTPARVALIPGSRIELRKKCYAPVTVDVPRSTGDSKSAPPSLTSRLTKLANCR